jgi:hypothetical protein
LQEAPSPAVIEAVVPIADDACIVILGRIARNQPALAVAVTAALDDIDTPRAAALALLLRQSGL